MTANEIAAANAADQGGLFNPQQQFPVSWPDSPAVARAYADQLQREGGLSANEVAALSALLGKAQKSLDGGRKDGATAGSLHREAGRLSAVSTSPRKTALAKVLEGLAARLR